MENKIMQDSSTHNKANNLESADDNKEEHKNSDQKSDEIISIKSEEQETATSHNGSHNNYYILPHMSEGWKSISETLESLAQGKFTLEEILRAIAKCIIQSQGKPYINILQNFLESSDPEKKAKYEKEIFPFLAGLVLKTPQLFPNKIPLLVQGKGGKIELSKEQCACLLANMFMCTTIYQENDKLPMTFNFSEMFLKEWDGDHLKKEKLKCVFNYFERIYQEIPQRSVTIERLILNEDVHGKCTLEGWMECQDVIKKAHIKPQGKIEDAEDSIEIDFANKYLGGCALRIAAAQEEIQFITSPELMVSILFTEFMTEKEAISMRGAEKYSNYMGYFNSFAFASNHQSTQPLNSEANLDREIVAIDALDFRFYIDLPQFSPEGVLREMNKAYVGFFNHDGNSDKNNKKAVSTGKWGCGVFQGDTQLKMIIQWLAASRAKREMYFYSFGDEKAMENIEKILAYYEGKQIGELLKDILKCCEEIDKLEEDQDYLLFNSLIALKSL